MKKKMVSIIMIVSLLGLFAYSQLSPQNGFMKIQEIQALPKNFNVVKEVPFNDALQISVKGDIREFAKNLKITDEEEDEILYLTNFLDKNKMAIAPLTAMGEVKLTANSDFTVEQYKENFYVQNKSNMKKIEKFLNINERHRYAPVYEKNMTMDMATAENREVPKSEMPTGAGKSSAKTENEFSKTNVQEKNIDEGDIVKTDGKYIYYMSKSKISIVSAQAKDTKKVAEIKYSQGRPSELLLYKNKLIAILQSYSYEDSYVYIYDLTDIKMPKIVFEKKVLGNPDQSRLYNSHLYIKSNYTIPIEYKRGFIFGEKAVLDTSALDLSKLTYIPANTTRDVVVISAINLDDLSKKSEYGIMTNSQTLYMSEKNIYLSYHDWRTPSFRFGFSSGYEENTVIRKFAVDREFVKYVGSTKVKGELLNQFSLGEKDDHLLVAYHDYVKDSNAVSVFDKDLKNVSNLENIAEGEKIYSTRFAGDKLYMVTFKQIDPLFVIDLSDIKQPKILGYLKIPGFSDYLHPYKNGYLIGFGQNTTNPESSRVRVDGFKLSLFDVRNFNSPKEVQSIVLGKRGSSSLVNRDHRALMVYEPKDLIGFEVHLFDERSEKNKDRLHYNRYYEDFEGAMLYKVTEKGFEFITDITHQIAPKNKEAMEYYYSDYDNSIQRLIYINGYVYSISNNFITATDLNSKKQIAKIEL